MAAAYLHRGVDVAVSFAFLAMLSFPALILAILTTKLAGRSLMTIAVTLGILGIAPVGRLARAQTLVFAERDFVTAARTMGATSRRVLIRELLPNVLIPMSALALLGMGVAIVAEGTLAFLGLSVEQQVTWGAMIFDGSGVADLEKSPLPAFFPAGFLFLTVLSLNFAGDRLRDYFDVRELSI